MSSDIRLDALQYHSQPRPGKVETLPCKPCFSQRDLTLAYSPGVAEPCLRIKEDPSQSALYTGRSNLVGVITNGHHPPPPFWGWAISVRMPPSR